MATVIAPSDDDEPFDEGEEEASADECAVPTDDTSGETPQHTRSRFTIRGDDGEPLDPKDLTAFKGALPSGSLGRIFDDDFMRSLISPFMQQISTLKRSDSVTRLLGQTSDSGVFGSAWLKVTGLTSDASFVPEMNAATSQLISSAIDASTWVKDYQGLAGAAWMESIPALTDTGWMKDLPGLTGVGSFTGNLFTDAQSQAILPAIAMPDFGLQIGLPSFITGFDVEPLLRSLRLQRVPSNWVDIDLDPDDAEESIRAVLADGIPLGWVPSERVVQLLLDAPDARARRRIISNNWRGILNDCDDVLGGLPAPRALRYADKLRRATAALRDAHTDAAQALATNILDTLVGHFIAPALGVPRSTLVNPTWNHKLLADGWRLALSLLPLETVMRGQFDVDHTGTGFRRNATVHAVTERQYNRINATIAIMLATSVLACAVRDTSAFD
ncbi:hypothetical protein C1N74_06500 [Microbacterium sp. SGAir0570]|uniref:hypothetical protein n=1 Tax=Microbacterium sp. SGAir0570 TaxID=2070348 RepID=UPI0010CD2F35|nr:hypothetical protein [Microbacterium sp. SGAir0570]QCR40106.1 hypothetical protein C1N74_06500 [Microbacterium sp. SGAir0570]